MLVFLAHREQAEYVAGTAEIRVSARSTQEELGTFGAVTGPVAQPDSPFEDNRARQAVCRPAFPDAADQFERAGLVDEDGLHPTVLPETATAQSKPEHEPGKREHRDDRPGSRQAQQRAGAGCIERNPGERDDTPNTLAGFKAS